MDGSGFVEKSSFMMLRLNFSSKLDWGSYGISFAKTASKIIGVLIRSMKLLSLDVVLYLYKFTIRTYMEYFWHVWVIAPSCYLESLDKLQKRICATVGRSLTASFEPLAHRRNVASLRFFFRHYFGICSSELVQLLYSCYSLFFFILIDCMIFLPPFLDVTKMYLSRIPFLAQLDSGILYLQNAFLWPMIYKAEV